MKSFIRHSAGFLGALLIFPFAVLYTIIVGFSALITRPFRDSSMFTLEERLKLYENAYKHMVNTWNYGHVYTGLCWSMRYGTPEYMVGYRDITNKNFPELMKFKPKNAHMISHWWLLDEQGYTNRRYVLLSAIASTKLKIAKKNDRKRYFT